MNYFIDESGDFGFGPKSPTGHIVVGCIKTVKSKYINRKVHKWEKGLLKEGWRPDKEIKWYTTLSNQRIEILKILASLNFEFRCVYIDKTNIPAFLHNKDNVLYGYMATELVVSSLDLYTENHIFLDEKSKLSHNYCEYHLKIKALCERPKDLNIHIHPASSTEVYGIRAVDFIAGAIRYGFDRKTNLYRDIIKDRIIECRELFKK